MSHTKKFSNKYSKFCRSLVATAFIASGVFQFVAPALAKAGDTISNTATATYEDPNDPGTTINATSNTVTVTLAEVAGIEVAPSATAIEFQSGGDTNTDGDFNAGDKVYFNFDVTNKGNDPTKFKIPAAPSVTDDNTGVALAQFDSTAGAEVEISTDGGANWVKLSTLTNNETPSIAPGSVVQVRVPVEILDNGNPTDGQQITVTLGNTATPGDQNIALEGGTPVAADLYTVDNADGAVADEVNGTPVNGVREASATQNLNIAVKAVTNGPNTKPDAVGPTDNNDDFTNKSSTIPAGTAPGSTIDPTDVTFDNTVKNGGNSTSDISLLPNETLLPNPGDLPGTPAAPTVVTITDPVSGQSATYNYDGTNFTFVSGTGGTSATNPVKISVPAGGTADYDVTVNLPDGTPLSTDIEKGFPVPITAFIDNDGDGVIDPTEPQNTTIDRVYTGFLKLVKRSRILQGTGPAVGAGQGDFATTPGLDADTSNDVERIPDVGNIIEYDVYYKNISETAPNADNVTLSAGNVNLIEDGTTGGNNWGKDNDSSGLIDTDHITGQAAATTGTITYFNGDPATNASTDGDTNVSKYQVDVGTVAPQIDGNFTFQRGVNGPTP
ncbi:MAG: hypothetical protein QNJ47_14205 [Nostocaceae cyanobacterium]|nr:hypothetical protein [Nostocaceae cyanobacterium]